MFGQSAIDNNIDEKGPEMFMDQEKSTPRVACIMCEQRLKRLQSVKQAQIKQRSLHVSIHLKLEKW